MLESLLGFKDTERCGVAASSVSLAATVAAVGWSSCDNTGPALSLALVSRTAERPLVTPGGLLLLPRGILLLSHQQWVDLVWCQPSLLVAAEVRVGALKQQHRVPPPSLIWEAKNPGPTSTICFPPLGYCLLWREVRPWSGCPLSGPPHVGLAESPCLCCGALGDAICPSGHERDPDEEELWKTQGCVVRGAEEGALP